ncbi:MAG: thermonuclease family protein [Clostridia bacterium]|nr:thermonuclease family protein [Clostridia bacterium]MBR5991569.1 thermonuclease family protein [Clostridia bacterium]
MKKYFSVLLLSVLAVFILTACNITVNLGERTTKENTTKETSTDATTSATRSELGGPYEVVRVVDGDTIIIVYNNEYTRLRFSNVDTPESVASEDSGKVNTEEGVVASDYTKKLLPEGSKVYLEFDNKTRDQFDRLLAYVYLEDGETMVQRLLLKDGMARVFNDKQNKRYTEEFFELQDAAKEAKIGIWAGENND